MSDLKEGAYATLLFFIWPFLAVLSALLNYEKYWAKNIFWAFCAFFGFVFAIGSETKGMDILQYIAQYQSLHGIEMSLTDMINYYGTSDEIDILRTLIAILLSRFTDNPSVLTLVYGTIFGYFLSRNLWYLFDRIEGKLLPITILLLTCFFLITPIWDINGFRMWTALHIFIYGLLPYLFEGDKRKIWISCSSILVHFSFIVPVSVLLMYSIFGNRYTFYFAFFMATFFIAEIDISFINSIVETYSPEILQERTEGYRTEKAVEAYRKGEMQTADRWYAIWYTRALNWSIVGFLIVIYFKGLSFFKKHPKWMNLLCFTLLFYGVANLLSTIPSGSRFLKVAQIGTLSLVILYVQNIPYEKTMKRFILVSTPALLLFMLVAIRIGLLSMSATAFLGNPIIALFLTGEHISLNEFLRMII